MYNLKNEDVEEKTLQEKVEEWERDYNELLKTNEYYIIAKKIVYKSLITLQGKGNRASYDIMYNLSSQVYNDLLQEVIAKMIETKQDKFTYNKYVEIVQDLNKYLKKITFTSDKEKKLVKIDYLKNKGVYYSYNVFHNLYKVVQNYLYNIKTSNETDLIEFTSNNDNDYNYSKDVKFISYQLQVAETDKPRYNYEEILNDLQLTERQTKILEMATIEKLPYGKIAKKLGIAKSTVKNTIFKVRNTLKCQEVSKKLV